MFEDAIDALLEYSVVGSFSRVGYAVRSRLDGWIPPSTLAGQHVLITGATSGIGEAAARALADLGTTLTLVGRRPENVDSTITSLRQRVSRSDIYGQVADVGDLDAVRTLVATLSGGPIIDVVVHNAGAITPTRQQTAQGFEVTLATQLLGPLLLTTALLGDSRRSRPLRVITVSSGGQYTEKFDLPTLINPPDPYAGVATYARVKRAQVVMNEALAARVPPRDALFACMHPGWVATPGLATSLPGFYRGLRPLLRTPREGADTIAWLTTCPDMEQDNGRFWHDRRPRSTSRLRRTRTTDVEADRQKLWEWSHAAIEPWRMQ